MEFREYLSVLRKYWVSILLITLVGLLAALAYVRYTPPMYTSSSMVFLSVESGATTSELAQGANYATTQTRTFAQLVNTPMVLNPVISKLGLTESASQLSSRVTSTIPTNTSLITITCRDGDPDRTAKITQAIANSLVAVVADLSPKGSNDKAAITATIVSAAVVPHSPTSPQLVQSVALGLVAGLVLGIGLAILRKVLDVRLHVAKDVTDATQSPVIASIPRDLAMSKGSVIMVSAPTSVIAERYRQLRTNLRFFDIDNEAPSSFVITSSLEGEGKTVTAINTAYAFAETGEKVLLIDADLRRPKVASYLHLEGNAGLTTVLVNRAAFSDVVQSLGHDCPDVMTSGPIPPNPTELIGSRRMKQFLEQVSREYQTVIIDTAPLLPVADTLLLLPNVTGTMLVASAERVTVPQLRSALDSVARTGAEVLGIVLNRVARQGRGHEYYNYTYGPAKEPASAAVKRRREPKRGLG